MKIFAVIIASLVLIFGIAYSRMQKVVGFKKEEIVLSAETNEELADEGVKKDTNDKNAFSYTQEKTITSMPSFAPTQTPSVTKSSDINTALDNFIYPGSEMVSSNDSSLQLRSSSDVDNITDWYKEKIRSLNMNVKSFVTTKTNDNVLNKLVGANGNSEISVEVKKEPKNNYSEISVSYNYN